MILFKIKEEIIMDKFEKFVEDLNKISKENGVYIAGVLQGNFIMMGETEDSFLGKQFKFVDGQYIITSK
jgi:hypothetical protein